MVLNERGHFHCRERRLTEVEIQERRKKGLCFHCDKKFSLDHHCKCQFHILLVHESEIVGQEEEEDDLPRDEAMFQTMYKVQISLNSLVGLCLRPNVY